MQHPYPEYLPKLGSTYYKVFRKYLWEHHEIHTRMRVTSFDPELIREAWIEFHSSKK